MILTYLFMRGYTLMQKRSVFLKNKRKQHQKKKLYRLATLLFIVSIFMMFNDHLSRKILSLNPKPSLEEIASSTKSKVEKKDFDYHQTKKANIISALRATFQDNNVPVIGAISIPDLEINLPILRGISDYAILMGAGTMKPEQKMGEGNYSLTSHHMLDESVLFGPLLHAEEGMLAYTTDLNNLYEYEITSSSYIKATDVHVIDNHHNTQELTLITCDETGEGRFMVKGVLNQITPIESTNQQLLDMFYRKQNLYQ